jgi:hypothetical protein
MPSPRIDFPNVMKSLRSFVEDMRREKYERL